MRLELANSPTILTISDDGSGFDPTAPRSAQSFGLQSMRERAESLGGSFAVESETATGTTVRVRVPG